MGNAKIKDLTLLHLTILLYTVSSLLTKYASRYDFLSWEYILIFCGMIMMLGIYAILWQQAIKKFSPSVAYSNKSIVIVWTMLASVLLFGEKLSISNVIGIVLIIIGIIMVVNGDE